MKKQNKVTIIPKGHMVYVSIKHRDGYDHRFFTNATKMKRWLTYLNRNFNDLKIRFKAVRLN